MRMRERFGAIIRLFAYAALIFGFGIVSAAQDETHVFRVEIGGPYQLQDSYSILYDNRTQAAKLKEFRVIFYNSDGQILTQTATETHPLNGNIETYQLSAPVIGFSEIGLSVLTLHSGALEEFPSNVGEIVGMDRTEVKPPPVNGPDVEAEEEGAEVTETLDVPSLVPTLSDADKQRLADTQSNLSALIAQVNEKSDHFVQADDSWRQERQRLTQLIADMSALSDEAESNNASDIKAKIDALNAKMIAQEKLFNLTESLTEIESLKTQGSSLQEQINELQNLAKTDGADISAILSSLAELEPELEALGASAAALNLPQAVSSIQIDTWNTAYLSLKAQLQSSDALPLKAYIIGLSVIFALGALGFGAKSMLSGPTNSRPSKSILNREGGLGVVFPASSLLAGNVATPLASTGQLVAGQLQMLTGPYAVLREAYEATGRIGYAQEGVPGAEDYSFGTGFLISDRHVMTNRHVHGLYGHYLLDKTDPGGIEFIAEKGKDASDFVPFNCEPPFLLPALDIAIYTLARPVKTRKPLQFDPINIEALEGREIVVVGYPDTHTPDRADILAVVEENPVFAVKRISQGRIFRHSTDTDVPFGVETRISENQDTSFAMPAICHNASTLGGNSGSPLLDIKTGQLVGVHFAGFKVFNCEEAANLAMAIAQLTSETSQKYLSAVTKVTDGSAKFI